MTLNSLTEVSGLLEHPPFPAGDSLLTWLVGFSQFLEPLGFPVYPSQPHDAMELFASARIGLSSSELDAILELTFASTPAQAKAIPELRQAYEEELSDPSQNSDVLDSLEKETSFLQEQVASMERSLKEARKANAEFLLRQEEEIRQQAAKSVSDSLLAGKAPELPAEILSQAERQKLPQDLQSVLEQIDRKDGSLFDEKDSWKKLMKRMEEVLSQAILEGDFDQAERYAALSNAFQEVYEARQEYGTHRKQFIRELDRQVQSQIAALKRDFKKQLNAPADKTSLTPPASQDQIRSQDLNQLQKDGQEKIHGEGQNKIHNQNPYQRPYSSSFSPVSGPDAFEPATKKDQNCPIQQPNPVDQNILNQDPPENLFSQSNPLSSEEQAGPDGLTKNSSSTLHSSAPFQSSFSPENSTFLPYPEHPEASLNLSRPSKSLKECLEEGARTERELAARTREARARLEKLKSRRKVLKKSRSKKQATLSSKLKKAEQRPKGAGTFSDRLDSNSKGREFGGLLPEERELLEKPIEDLSAAEIRSICEMVKDNAMELKTRMRHNLAAGKRMNINMAETIRQACRTGGLPFRMAFDYQRPGKARIVLVLDVSGSCSKTSRMMLAFLHALGTVFPGGIKAFAFVDSLHEITRLPEEDDTNQAISDALSAIPSRGIPSDYYKPLVSLWQDHKIIFTSETITIFIGDARNNRNPSGEELFKSISRKSRFCFFLNTESRADWNTGDSIASIYEQYSTMLEVTSAADLLYFLQSIRL